MGRVIDTRQFSREGKQGTLLTVKVRAPSERVARSIAVSQIAPRFPGKVNNITSVGLENTGKLFGPFNNYEVDVFVPVRDSQESRTESGDTRKGNQMT